MKIPSLEDGLQFALVSIFKALQFSLESGFQHLLVEFSHPHLKALMQFNEDCVTELEDQITCIRNISANFAQLDFIISFGSCNRAAKLLISYAKENKEPSV